MTSLLLRDAALAGVQTGPEGTDGPRAGACRADIRVSGGIVTEVAAALDRRPGEEVIDCAGGAVLPGLTDHHLHLLAMAAARASVRCGPPDVTSRAALAAALATARPDKHGWIRGTGYVESVAGDLDAPALDALRADRPVRIQHRSGALWMLNTAALAAIGATSLSPSSHSEKSRGSGDLGHLGSWHPADSCGRGIERDSAGRPTGRLWRADAWLRSRLPRGPIPGLAPAGRELLGFGITAVTDATPDLAPEAIAAISDAMRRGELPPRVHLLGVPLGAPLPVTPGLTVGPYKIVLADSGLPTYADLAELVAAAHAAGRAVAVHCVTREALVLLIAVLRDLGTLPGDRIEHAALVPGELLGELAGHRLRVVTQPGFLPDRGDDFVRGVPPAEHPDLYRCATLRQAGIPLALSSDAPYGPLNPWANIAAATTRRTASGQVTSPSERLTTSAALNAYLAPPEDPGGPPASVRPGQPANLIVLSGPLPDLSAQPHPVRAVLAAGHLLKS